MSDAFISYSRKDAAFVQRLNTAFVQANRVIWVDWQDIARGEDWWREIERGIEEADTFLCAVSEYWLTSEICHRELSYARSNHKRVIPLIRQKIEGDVEKRAKGSWMDSSWEQQARENWDYLRHLNWIFLDNDGQFDVEFPALLKTLESDQPHIKAHTRYQNLALEWERSERNPSYLLNGENLAFAEGWLKVGMDKEPEPTLEQQAFITASRDDENAQFAKQYARETQIRRFRWAAAVLSLVGILALLAAIGASVAGIKSKQDASTATVAQGAAIYGQRTAIAQANAAQDAAATATSEQGYAQNGAATAGAAQGTAQYDAHIAQTQVVIAGVILTSIPPTVTALAGDVVDAKQGRDITTQLADALLRVMEGSRDAALKVGNYLVDHYPKKALAYFSRGLINDVLSLTGDALADYDKAIDLDPTFARVYMDRALIYTTLNHYDYALVDYDKAIEIDPSFPRAYNNRGAAYLYLEQYIKAIADFSKVLELDPTYTQAYSNRGNTYRILKQYEKAIVDFSNAIKLSPQNALLLSYRGKTYNDLKQYDNALADFNKAIELKPANADYYNYRGNSYNGLKQYNNALVDFNKAIELKTKDTSVYSNRGITYYFSQKYEEALADWEHYEALGGKLTPEVEAYRTKAKTMVTQTPTLTATPKNSA